MILVGVGALLFLIFMFGSSIADSREKRARERASALAAERDSLQALAAMARPENASIETLRAVEQWLNQAGRHQREHAALHQRYISSQLAELSRLASATPPNVAAANAIVATIDTFYSRDQRGTFRRDTARINSARRREERQAAEAQRTAEVAARKLYARTLEKTYLDQGLDVTVTTRGAEARTLRIKWILVSRVVAHQFSQNQEIFSTLRTLGFRRLEISDGYDEEWYWTINR